MKQSVYLFFLLILFNNSLVNASEKISLISLNDLNIIFSTNAQAWNQNLVFLDNPRHFEVPHGGLRSNGKNQQGLDMILSIN